MNELTIEEINEVGGGDVAGLGQAMATGGAILLGIAALPVAAPVAGIVGAYGAVWGLGGAIMWGMSQMG
jgi:hypothetical protein